jgi:hypothetical protein
LPSGRAGLLAYLKPPVLSHGDDHELPPQLALSGGPIWAKAGATLKASIASIRATTVAIDKMRLIDATPFSCRARPFSGPANEVRNQA